MQVRYFQKNIVRFVICALFLFLSRMTNATPVYFADTNLENAVRDVFTAQGTPLGSTIDSTDLVGRGFTELFASGRNISSLDGLDYATDLQSLILFRNNITDIAPLASLPNLTKLDLGWNQINDLSPLAVLPNLTYLELGFGNFMDMGSEPFVPDATGTNQISDLIPLSGLTNLVYLNLCGNTGITNIHALASLAKLEQLWLGSSLISDFSPLADFTSLHWLVVFYCGFTDAHSSYIAGLTQLELLGLAGPGLTTLSPFTGMNPQIVILLTPELSTIDPIAHWTHLTTLMIKDTQVSGLGPLSGLPALRTISMSGNPIVDLSPLAVIPTLTDLEFEQCHIADLAPLQNLTLLRGIFLKNNQITSLEPLAANPGVGSGDTVDVRGNPISLESACRDVPVLRSRIGGFNFESDAVCGPSATLTLHQSGPGRISPEEGSHVYPLNESAYIDALPTNGSGYAFSRWQGDIDSTNLNENVVMDSDKTVEAVFVPGDHLLTVLHGGNGVGASLPSPGTYSYLHGQTARLTAHTVSGIDYFGGWKGDASGFYQDVSIFMDRNRMAIAMFEKTGHVLNLIIEGEGRTLPTEGLFRLTHGATLTLFVTGAPSGWRFGHWESSLPNANFLAQEWPIVLDQDMTITAVFIHDDPASFHFTQLPQDGHYDLGQPLLLQTAFEGSTGPVSMQWLRDGMPISGANNAQLEIAQLTLEQGGIYILVVRDGQGTYQTPPVLITVRDTRHVPATNTCMLTALILLLCMGGIKSLQLRQH